MDQLKRKPFPFAAIAGQDDMKMALLLNVINPAIRGVLIRGEKGTAKSTAVRGLVELLEETTAVADCRYHCNFDEPEFYCPECKARLDNQETLSPVQRKKRVIELPVSATNDRVVGTLDIERALKEGVKVFEPGILAEANNNLLYIDEVNLLEDHVVDVLLDSAAMGVNTVEREGVSYSHPARFILIGTMNPEEGDLRPQLLDRFGLLVQVRGEADKSIRKEIIKRRLAYEQDAQALAAAFAQEENVLRKRIAKAREILPSIEVPEEIYDIAVNIGITFEVDGHRADITLIKTAKTISAFEAHPRVTREHVLRAAALALPHRMRKHPFENTSLDMQRIRELVFDE